MDPWDFKKLDKFRLNFEAGSIDPESERSCLKFKEGLTCRVEDNRPGDDKKMMRNSLQFPARVFSPT
jgi:hypothetical protein